MSFDLAAEEYFQEILLKTLVGSACLYHVRVLKRTTGWYAQELFNNA